MQDHLILLISQGSGRDLHDVVEKLVLGTSWYHTFLIPRMKCRRCHKTAMVTSDASLEILQRELEEGKVVFKPGHHLVKLSSETYVTLEAFRALGPQLCHSHTAIHRLEIQWKKAYLEHATWNLRLLMDFLAVHAPDRREVLQCLLNTVQV